MHTITFFAPKGGTGRTTAIVAVAAALIDMGHRVGVLDLTEQARWPFGPSDISRWEDSMVTSGIGAEALTTAPGWDRQSVARAFERFADIGCTRVLVDTSRDHSDLTEDVINQSDLVILPFVSCLEAQVISDWGFTARYPQARAFGLATGLVETPAQIAFHRRAFFGMPLLNTGLLHTHLFELQVPEGSLYLRKANPDEPEESEEHIARACANATALAQELDALLTRQSRVVYLTQRPLATGHHFAHVQALKALSPGLFD
jgi:VirC1 protein